MNKLIIIAVCFVLALILGLTLVLPKYQSLQFLQTSIQERSTELQFKEAYFSQVKEIAKQLEEYEEALAKISSALPQEPSLPSLFNFLQSISSQTGLILEKMSLGSISSPQEEKNNLKEIHVSLQLAGAYSAFKDFLAAIEKSSRIIEIEDITFKTPKEPTDSFSFDVQIKTYSY
ncbi:hypothetical protein ES703_03502 [subsurface metagenome]